MTRVAVASQTFSRHPKLRAELLARYPDTTFNENAVALRGESLIAFVRGHEKAITGLEPLDETVFRALPELRAVGKYGVGLDMIDLAAMARAGVRLGWTGGTNKRAVAELVIAFAILLLRRLPEVNGKLKEGAWHRPVGRLLSQRTVGIIGLGHVGKDLALLLRAFGATVLAHDILDFPDFCAAHGVSAVDLETLLRESEIVTLHVPLDSSTRGMLGRERLARMKPGAILINAARGNIVDEGALKAMLEDGRLAAAAFDVFAIEPLQDLELVRLPNFYGTPHVGGSAEESVLAMGRAAIAGLDDNRLPGNGWPVPLRR